LTVLILAPHADDEVLGMGGTIARLTDAGTEVVLAVLTGHGEEPHPLWTRDKWDRVRGECREACARLGIASLQFRELPAACLDTIPMWRINETVSELVRSVQPTTLYVPFAFDLHKDHHAIAYAAAVATRAYIQQARSIQRILAYETLSETHLGYPYMAPAFQPNVFVDISATLDRKLDAMRAYASQIQNDNLPRSIQAIRSLAHLRGVHMGTAAAEAFYLLGEYER
jgi:N-acetylglucosamine malate deacetylase 1